MNRAKRGMYALVPWLLFGTFACSGNESGTGEAGGSGSTASGHGAGGAGGSGGHEGGGGAASCAADPCEQYAARESCCADPACGWHHNTGHQIKGVPPCVSRERVCVVGGVDVRECAAGMTCLRQGASQDTENDCTLPPPGQVSLLDRGICVCD